MWGCFRTEWALKFRCICCARWDDVRLAGRGGWYWISYLALIPLPTPQTFCRPLELFLCTCTPLGQFLMFCCYWGSDWRIACQPSIHLLQRQFLWRLATVAQCLEYTPLAISMQARNKKEAASWQHNPQRILCNHVLNRTTLLTEPWVLLFSSSFRHILLFSFFLLNTESETLRRMDGFLVLFTCFLYFYLICFNASFEIILLLSSTCVLN